MGGAVREGLQEGPRGGPREALREALAKSCRRQKPHRHAEAFELVDQCLDLALCFAA